MTIRSTIKEAYTESIPENKLWTFIKNGLSYKMITSIKMAIFRVFLTLNHGQPSMSALTMLMTKGQYSNVLCHQNEPSIQRTQKQYLGQVFSWFKSTNC